MAEYLEVTLANIGDGTLDEKFHNALAKIIANIMDPNTPAEAKRGMSIDITFAPSEDREQIATAIEVKEKLAPQKRKLGQIHIVVDRRTGKNKAVTATFEQKGLFDPAEASRQMTEASAAAPEDPTKPAA